MHPVVKIFLQDLLGRAALFLDRQKVHRLKRSLAYCGANVFLDQPLTIHHAESVSVGDGSSIAGFCHIWGKGGVEIGRRVMIASHAAITSMTHDWKDEAMFRSLVCRRVVIEDDVWIGAHSVILPGVTIGRGSVVGACSLVNHDVPPDCVGWGVPFVVTKQRSVSPRNI